MVWNGRSPEGRGFLVHGGVVSGMTWGELFERAPDDVSVDEVRAALAERRESVGNVGTGRDETDGDETDDDGTGDDA